MANIIALIIFSGSFIGLAFLVFKKVSVLANLPEQTEQSAEVSKLMKQNILQKTNLIKQAVLHNRGVGAVGVVMTKTSGRFKAIFANRVITKEDSEKVEKIHKEGDYWQKVETHNALNKKRASNQPKIKIVQASAVEIKETEPQLKKSRLRKKKMPE